PAHSSPASRTERPGRGQSSDFTWKRTARTHPPRWAPRSFGVLMAWNGRPVRSVGPVLPLMWVPAHGTLLVARASMVGMTTVRVHREASRLRRLTRRDRVSRRGGADHRARTAGIGREPGPAR